MGHYLGTVPNTKSVVVRDNTALGMMPKTPKAYKGHNSLNTCSNEASKRLH